MPRFLTALAAGTAALALLAGVACSDKPNSPLATGGDNPSSQGATATAEATGQAGQAGSSPTSAAGSSSSGSSTSGGDLSVADVVRLAEPSVVRIQTASGVGTGFIIDEAGHVITNNHVVEGSAVRSIRVTLSDGTDLGATIVGTDPRADLALLKIEATGLKALKVGKLDEVFVGQDVVAIGYALDLKKGEGPSYSVTRGIVSAKNRAISESAQILGAIQTDAAINHGNSGGPLLNLEGEVIGVNTALAPDPSTASGVASGIGFAVGADTVRAVYEQLRDTGRVNRGLLGITGFDALRPAKARELGIPDDIGGVYLAQNSVSPGPAAQAGLAGGDVIVKIGETVIRNESDLAIAMIQNPPNSSVAVEYYRDGERHETTVTLGTATSQ